MPILMWVIYLVVGILVTMLGMIIVRKIEELFVQSNGANSDSKTYHSMFDSPIFCILVDIIIYLISGMFLCKREYPVWAVAIYAVTFELVTQSSWGLSSVYPEFFHASWMKSVADVTFIVLSYIVGGWLQKRAHKQGARHERKKLRKLNNKRGRMLSYHKHCCEC
jgi:hypothetical protein